MAPSSGAGPVTRIRITSAARKIILAADTAAQPEDNGPLVFV